MAADLPEHQAQPLPQEQDPEESVASLCLQSVSDPADGVNDMDRVQETLRVRTSKVAVWVRRSSTEDVGVPNRSTRCGQVKGTEKDALEILKFTTFQDLVDERWSKPMQN